MRNEMQNFTDMLIRAGIGHGTRPDHPGCSIQVETGENEIEAMVTEFAFDEAGLLTGVSCYPNEVG